MNGTNYEVPHCGAFSTPHSHPSRAQIFVPESCFQIPLACRAIPLLAGNPCTAMLHVTFKSVPGGHLIPCLRGKVRYHFENVQHIDFTTNNIGYRTKQHVDYGYVHRAKHVFFRNVQK